MGKRTRDLLLARMAASAAKREQPAQQQPDSPAIAPQPQEQAQQVQREQPEVQEQQPLMQAGAQPGETAEQTGQRLEETPVKKQFSYKELYEKLNPQPTPEELEKRRKKEKREKLWASIGDGLNALSSMANLYYTTKGAPNMYKHTDSLSDKARERWEKLQKEFDAKDQAYAAGIMKARQLDEATAENEKKWKRLFDKDKDDAERRKKAAELAAQKAADDKQYKKDRLDEQARHNKEMEAAAKEANKARMISAKKSGSKSGSGSGEGKYIVYPPASSGKKPFAAKTKSEYDYWNTFFYGSDNKNKSKTLDPTGEHVISRTETERGKNSTIRAAEAKAKEAREAKEKAAAAAKAKAEAEAKKKAEAKAKAAKPRSNNGYANTKKLGL